MGRLMRVSAIRDDDGRRFNLPYADNRAGALVSLGQAVEEDHPCMHHGPDNHACDIAAALRADYPDVAAFLLLGATECPFTERVLWALRFNGVRLDPDHTDSGFLFSARFDEWVVWFRANSVPCHSCNGFNFTDEFEPEHCGNCNAVLIYSGPCDTCGRTVRDRACLDVGDCPKCLGDEAFSDFISDVPEEG